MRGRNHHTKRFVLSSCHHYGHNVVLTQKVSTLASMLTEYATPADAIKTKEVELVKQVLVCVCVYKLLLLGTGVDRNSGLTAGTVQGVGTCTQVCMIRVYMYKLNNR